MHSRITTVLLSLVAVAIVGAGLASPSVVSPVVAQEEITITDLGTLGGANSYAYGINDLGQVVGMSATADLPWPARATLWEKQDDDDGTWLAQDLGTLGGANSRAYGINDLGQVVGWSETADGRWHAALWEKQDDGTWLAQDLGTLSGGVDSEAYGINDLGQVVGVASTADGRWHATLWEKQDDGTWLAQDLGTLSGGVDSYAESINDLGQVVGESHTADGPWHAALWEKQDDGTWLAQDLGTLSGGVDSYAYGINDLGQVVGMSATADLPWPARATLWEKQDDDDGTWLAQDLGTLSGGVYSHAWSINDFGQVVGWSETADGPWRATLWEKQDDGTWLAQDLGTLSGGGVDSRARGINNLGQVVGWSETADGPWHAALWQVPPPVISPDEAIEDAAEAVAALVADGTLDDGEARALTSKLEAAQHQLDKGNAKPAANILGAFINQVEAMVSSGRLTAEEAKPLIDSANAAIELIEAEP